MTAVALRARSAASTLGLALVVFVSCAAAVGMMLATDGNPAAVLAPVVIAAAAWAMWTLPVRTTAFASLFLMLVAEYPPELPYSGHWQSPFFLLGKVLFTNLSTLTGISPLRLPLMDMIVLGLLALRGWRRSKGSTLDDTGVPPVRPLNRALLLSLGMVVALDVLGVATGGDFNESLWQLRHLLLFPLTALMFIGCLKGTETELWTIWKILVASALVKALCGIYFIYFIVRPNNLFVEFTTSHSDTLLYVAVFAGFAAYFFEKPYWGVIRRSLWWLAIALLGMKLNDRRLAYVSLSFSLVAIYLLQPNTWLKRRIFQTAVLAVPVLALYLAVGWDRGDDGIWKVSGLVKSLIVGEHTAAGADYRDIENADVISTWSDHAFLPSGFGHKFHEPIKLPDISFIMPTYQFHPHNQLLWMWTIGGVLGFTFMFAPWVVALLLAARSHRFGRKPIDRAAALTCISFIIAHLNQVYGDMGTRTHFGSILGGLAVAMAAKLAVRSGAWR